MNRIPARPPSPSLVRVAAERPPSTGAAAAALAAGPARVGDEVPALAARVLPPPSVRPTPPAAPAGGALALDPTTWVGAQRTLQSNWQGSYTAPSLRRPSSWQKPLDPALGYRTGDPGEKRLKYPRQWLWDSGFHALVHVDLGHLEHARTELAHLLALQRPDGFIADMSGTVQGQPVQITQPPNLGEAALALLQQGALPEGAYERIKAFHAWVAAHSDAHGIFAVRSGLESGMDTSPVFDVAHWGDKRGGPVARALYQLSRLVHDFIGTAPPPLLPRPNMGVRSLVFNCLRARDLEAMAEVAAQTGRDADAAAFRAEYGALKDAMRAQMRDPAVPFLLRNLDKKGRPIDVRTADQFLPLYAGLLTADEARDLVGYLTDPKNGFWTKYPVATTAQTEPAFGRRDYWRGPTWVNINYAILQGLLRYGYYPEAKELYEKTLAMLQQNEGPMRFNECYDPLDGTAVRQGQFGWATLVVSMERRLREYERAHGVAGAPAAEA